MSNNLIGVDLGTTGCRAIVYSENLDILSQCYIEYQLIKISEKMIEQDAGLWWRLVKQTVRAVLKDVSSETIRGISVSSQGIAFVPIDKDGLPLRNAISWLDMRAQKQIQDIKKRFCEEELFRITGKRANEAYVLPKLLWLRENQKSVYDNTAKFLMPHDYIVYKLCGEIVTDHTMASGTLLYDVTKQSWSSEILEAFDIDPAKLPALRWSGTNEGTLSKDAASELGLSEHVAVAVGGQDQKCAALGAGISNSTATVSLGTATAITKKWNRPYIDAQMRVPVFSDLVKDRWVTEGVLITGGVSLKWLNKQLFTDDNYDDINEIVNDSIQKQTDSNVFFFPHLAGAGSPRWYPDACGCIYGVYLNTKKSEIAQALYEGIAFQIKSNLGVMAESADIDSLIVFGGGAKSAVWCQIIADITGVKVMVSESSETASRGAAMLAGLGSGVFKALSDMDKLSCYSRVHTPDKDRNRLYQAKYEKYCNVEERLWANRCEVSGE